MLPNHSRCRHGKSYSGPAALPVVTSGEEGCRAAVTLQWLRAALFGNVRLPHQVSWFLTARLFFAPRAASPDLQANPAASSGIPPLRTGVGFTCREGAPQAAPAPGSPRQREVGTDRRPGSLGRGGRRGVPELPNTASRQPPAAPQGRERSTEDEARPRRGRGTARPGERRGNATRTSRQSAGGKPTARQSKAGGGDATRQDGGRGAGEKEGAEGKGTGWGGAEGEGAPQALTDEEDGEGDEEQEDVRHHVERVHEAAVVEHAVVHVVGGGVALVAAESQGHGGTLRAAGRCLRAHPGGAGAGCAAAAAALPAPAGRRRRPPSGPGPASAAPPPRPRPNGPPALACRAGLGG